MRIVLAASGEVALPTLRALGESRHEIAAVVTQPARRAGRARHLAPTPVEAAARAAGLAVRTCEDINSAQEVLALGELAAELIVVVDFGQKIGQTVRRTAPRGAINLHASLLPALRGAAPIQWACIRGLRRTGVTTFQLVDRMDAGPVWLQEAVEIDPEETADDLRGRLAELGAQVVLRTLEGLTRGTIEAREQDEALPTRAPKLTKDDGIIDFSEPAPAIVNRIRGCWSWPGACAEFVHGDRPPVHVIFARAQGIGVGAGPFGGTDPGTIAPRSGAEDLCVRAGEGAVEILQLKVAGKRLMDWRDFVNGYRAAAGDRFCRPQRPEAI